MIETNAQAPTGRWHLQPDEMVVLARIAHRYPHLADAEAALAEVGALRQRVADLEERLREAKPVAAVPVELTVGEARREPVPPGQVSAGDGPFVPFAPGAPPGTFQAPSQPLPRPQPSRPAPPRRTHAADRLRGKEPMAVRLVRNGPSIGWALAWRLSALVSGPIALSFLARQPRLTVLAATGGLLAITSGWLAMRGGVGAIWRAVLCSAMVASVLELHQIPFQVATGLTVVLGGLLSLDAVGSVLRRR
jgi:hypothetical protein